MCQVPPLTFSIFGLPFNMVNTSTFLSLKTIKLHNKKWKRPETMKRVRHELFFIEKNRSLQLEVKTCKLFIIRNGRGPKQWKEFAMSCFSSKKIDPYSWKSKVVFPTIRRKDIDHGIFVSFQGGVECNSVE